MSHRKTHNPKPASKSSANNVQSDATLSSPRTEHLTPANIMQLQRTIGNRATQRVLNNDLTGNDMTLQRQMNFRPDQLSGKTGKTGASSIFDNKRTSTFRLIENALTKFHATARDDYDSLRTLLTAIIENCDKWLGDIDHLQQSDEEKRVSLQTLRNEAWVERRRVIITKQMGVPYQMADTFSELTINDLWNIIVALDTKQPRLALTHFETYKGYLSNAAVLVKQFMTRNYIQLFNPQLATSMNASKFEMDSKSGANAQALIVAEARAKLAKLAAMQAEFNAVEHAFKSDPNPNKKQTDHPLLDPNNQKHIDYVMAKSEKAQYEGIVSGKTIPQKKNEKELKKLSDAELYSIVGYTSNLFSTINTGLRNNVTDPTKFTAAHVELSEAMTSGLQKLERHKGQVFRHNGDFPGFSAVNVQNATVVEIAPTSTAVSQAACASAGTQHEVLEVFTSINGRDVSKASVFGSGEQEILFVPGTRFKVVAAFARRQSAWNTKHDPSQYHVHEQQSHPYFAQAMQLAANDNKRDAFHRIIFKTELG